VALRSIAPTKTSKMESNPIKGDHAAPVFAAEALVDMLAIK
jgi:hypothetical protein